ncbi:hypothetical protein G6F43_009011 [Rhizopus delemar]|nr:hypothetical protein G6F43_009011 [Rhizopus delemar]
MRSFLILATFALACLVGNNSAAFIKRDDNRKAGGILPLVNNNDILNHDKILKGNEILTDGTCVGIIGCKLD